jgi:selenide,water dikinase
LSQQALAHVLRQLPKFEHPNLLVGTDLGDDAGVYRLDASRALVQTLDFLTPIIDDPQLFGQIAAANSLSDVYAMGGQPLTALNILGVPEEKLSPEATGQILLGGARKLKEAGCLLVGGHTMRNPEPFYGLSVTGLVNPRKMITNAAARPGDLLVLTKPLGTGVLGTGVKRGLVPPNVMRRMARVMCGLNSAGATLGRKGLVRAGVDVTGFGLICHLHRICAASGVAAEIQADAVPVIAKEVADLIRQGCISGGTRNNQLCAAEFTDWGNTPQERQVLLCDAQTSGGLLLCVKARNWPAVKRVLKAKRAICTAVIGRMIRARKPIVVVR